MIPSFHGAGTPFFQILLKRLYSMLTGVNVCSDGFCWYLVRPCSLPTSQSHDDLLNLCLWGFFAADRQFCLCGWDPWWRVRGGVVQQFPEVFCPSFELFLSCCQWVPVLVLHWLSVCWNLPVSFLVSSYRVPQIPLSGCCLCLSSFVIDVVPLIILDVARSCPSLVVCLLEFAGQLLGQQLQGPPDSPVRLLSLLI